MQKHNELVSIGMPVFNDIQYIERALKSILNQTYGNFELIISDDGSSDGSADVCKQYAANDNRIKYIRQKHNIGISKNMMFLLAEARGDYFMWAADDDLWDPEFIDVLKKGLEENQDAIMAFCPYQNVNDSEQPLDDYGLPIDPNTSRRVDYSSGSAIGRIHKLIFTFDDACGYGLFRRKQIQNVKFPIWWGVNKRRAYNNIYPTLCYYLTKGNYVLCGTEVLWFNRWKSHNNHQIPYTTTFVRSVAAFILWKFNLVCFSIREIWSASKNILLCTAVFPTMFFMWFVKPTTNAIYKRFVLLLKRKVSFY